MSLGRIEALAQPNCARLDDDTSLPKRCEPIAADKHTPNAGTAPDAAAGEAAPAAPGRSAAARQVGGRENTMQELARALAAAACAHAAKPGFELFIVRHNRRSSSQERPDHALVTQSWKPVPPGSAEFRQTRGRPTLPTRQRHRWAIQKKRCADKSLWPVAASGQCHSFSILPS
jgi:hypothetical protein